MVLTNGLRALANPTRLRVLELLKDPAAFDGPRGDDRRPLGGRSMDGRALTTPKVLAPTSARAVALGIAVASYLAISVRLVERLFATPPDSPGACEPGPSDDRPRDPRPGYFPEPSPRVTRSSSS